MFDVGLREAIVISPNPSDGLLNLKLSGVVELPYEITVFNQFGQIVFETTLTQIRTRLDLGQLSSGVYFVSGDGLMSFKIVIFNE